MVHHSSALRAEGAADELIESLGGDLAELPLDHRTWMMLEYARKLTLEADAVAREDVDRLKEAGLDDRGCLEVVLVTAYFNFVNRIAEGLGVELETERSGSDA